MRQDMPPDGRSFCRSSRLGPAIMTPSYETTTTLATKCLEKMHPLEMNSCMVRTLSHEINPACQWSFMGLAGTNKCKQSLTFKFSHQHTIKPTANHYDDLHPIHPPCAWIIPDQWPKIEPIPSAPQHLPCNPSSRAGCHFSQSPWIPPARISFLMPHPWRQTLHRTCELGHIAIQKP